MKLFKTNKLTDEEVTNLYNNLTQSQKIEILIKWFGIKPLSEKMFKDKQSIEHIKQGLKKWI